MSWLIGQFLPSNLFNWVSMLLQTVTWPAAMVVVAAMFRAEVRKLLERLVHLKIQDVEAQFERELCESEELATQAIEPRRLLKASGESMRIIHELDGQSELIPIRSPSTGSPRTSIEESWTALALAADRACGTSGIDPVRALVEKGILSGSTLLLFERLRQLRLRVVRQDGWEPSAELAERYASLARTLATKIEKEGSHIL